jgi:hypothetical protein
MVAARQKLPSDPLIPTYNTLLCRLICTLDGCIKRNRAIEAPGHTPYDESPGCCGCIYPFNNGVGTYLANSVLFAEGFGFSGP